MIIVNEYEYILIKKYEPRINKIEIIALGDEYELEKYRKDNNLKDDINWEFYYDIIKNK